MRADACEFGEKYRMAIVRLLHRTARPIMPKSARNKSKGAAFVGSGVGAGHFDAPLDLLWADLGMIGRAVR
jgi:hypothetical protein